MGFDEGNLGAPHVGVPAGGGQAGEAMPVRGGDGKGPGSRRVDVAQLGEGQS